MATVLGLALKISADASGVQEKLTPVQKAIQQLDKETAKVTAVFDKFGSSSAAAAAQQEKFGVRLAALNESLQRGLTSPAEYIKQFDALSKAASEAADDLSAASRVIEANLTREERAQREYQQSTAELNRLRDAGMLGEEDYARALQRVSTEYAKATIAADKYDDAVSNAGDGGTLKFNELSGVLSALPGPIGNVAGRLSGLASAGEGLSRIFSGGLSQGISGIGASVAGLVNPFTAAVAGVAAFGAGAVAVARGLADLEDRVEKLGNTADKLGVSFEFIQTLEAAANRSGTSVEAVSAAFGRLQKNVTGIDEESKAAQAALSSIGVTAEELAALKPEEQYRLIGERLQAIEDPAKRTAASMGLFGKSGADLLPFFKNLGGAANDMERFGRALTDIDRRRIDDFGAGLDALSVATQGLGQTLLLPFVGLGEGLAVAAAEFTASITAIADIIGRLLAPVLDQIGTLVQAFAAGIGLLTPVFRLLAEVIEPIGQFLLPAVVAQLIAINRIAVAGAIRSLATTFTAAAGSLFAYSGAAGIATVANAAFSLSIRTLLSSTGVGALVVVAGLAVQALVEWGMAGDETAEGLDKTTEAAKQSAEEAAKATEQLNKAVEASQKTLDGVINKAAEFGQAGFDAAYEFQQALADLQDQADSGELNAEQYARGVANATAEYDKQIDQLKQVQEETKRAADEAKKRLDADKQVSDQLLEQARVNREFGGDSNRAKAAEQVLAVEREIARVKEEVAAARDGGDAQAVANGEERLRQLGVIKTEQQAIADGSAKAAENERKRLEDQRKSVDAMLRAGQEQTQLEKDIIAVQEQQLQAQADIVAARLAGNQQEADAAAARLAQLDQLDAKLQDRQQAAEQGFADGFVAAFAKVDEAIGKSVNKAAEFGNAGAEAAMRLTDGIAAAQQQAADGILNKEAFEQEVQRQQELFDGEVKRLDELKKKKIKDAADVEAEQEKARGAALKAQEAYQKDQLKAQETFAKQQQQAQEEYAKEQARVAEEQRKAAEAEAKRQEERLEKLNTLGQQTIKSTDIRTQEGAALVLNLASNAQDPALIQQRLQTKYLEQISLGIARAAGNYFNTPVSIVGYSSFGAPI